MSAGAGDDAGLGRGHDLPVSVPKPHYLEDCASRKIDGTNWVLQGHSQAGNRTGFFVPQLNLGLDAGMNSFKTFATILISHSHADHSYNITCLAMGQGDFESKPLVVCPADMVPPLDAYTRAAQSLNCCFSTTMSEPVVRAKGVSPGDTMTLCNGKCHVRVVQCVHEVPTCGFILSTVSKKLKPEYRGMAGKDIAGLRKAGAEVSQEVLTERIAFLGDTTVEVFTLNPCLLKVPIVCVECTFVSSSVEDAETATSRGHTSWRGLDPFVKAAPDTLFILIHFSRRYKDADIVEFFEGLEGGCPDNVLLWLDSGPHGPRAGPTAKPAFAAK